MRRRRRLVVVGLAVAATATAVVAALLTAPTGYADVGGPNFATDDNASDPHIIKCTDPSTNTAGYCLYTSRDMGEDFAYPPANYYPMEETRAYFSTNGYSDWVDKGTVFHEDTLEADWVPDNAYHLWAPSAVKSGSYYYLFVPDVSDVSDDAAPNIHTSSRIAVARSTSPFGTFSYRGTVTVDGYMSDPDVVIDGSTRYLVWADGDMSTCGGFKIAQLGSDMMAITSGTTSSITINGIEVLGSCDPAGSAGPIGRPYMEGASIYKTGSSSWALYFAAKPDDGPDSGSADDIPAECRSGVGGNDSTNSVIAWATASSAAGPYTYRGIVMCGSTTEWTNQATVAFASNNRKIVIYHDSPANVKERKLHAECLFYYGNIVAVVQQQAMNASNGFNDCMSGTNAAYWAWHLKDPDYPAHPPIIRAPSDGTALVADRYAVTKTERYKTVSLGDGKWAIQALSNGRYLCTANTSTAITASCTSTSSTGVQWTSESVGGGYYLKSVSHNRYLSVAGNKNLYASATGTSTAAVLTFLLPGGKPN